MHQQSETHARAPQAGLSPAPPEIAGSAAPGRRFRAFGQTGEVKLDREATNGAFAVIEMTDAPGSGPPRHVHGAEDEIFYVLEGRLRFWRGSETFVGGPGAVIHMPRNVAHAYRNLGETESRMLVVITPGRLQGFFEEAAALDVVMPRDAAVVSEIAGRYGIEVLGPPPGDEESAVSALTDTHHGACFCGAVTIEAKGTPLEMGYCHCQSCRAYSGGPVSAFILWRSENVRVTRGEALLGRFNKTGMSERTFCTKCGGHLITRHPGLGLTDVRPSNLPGLPFKPFVHLNYAEAVLRMRDGLLKLKDFPATAGGSGETLPE